MITIRRLFKEVYIMFTLAFIIILIGLFILTFIMLGGFSVLFVILLDIALPILAIIGIVKLIRRKKK